MPDREITAGEFVALLVTLTLPDTLPAAVGANTTFSVADWFGVRVVPALRPLVLNPAPAGATPEIVTFEFPLFVMVTLEELLLPSLTLPKLRLVGLAPSKCVAATPVPLSEIASGEFGALLTSEMDPFTAPADPGANTALNVVVLPALTVAGTLIPVMLNPAPVTFACVIVRAAVPPFVKVIVCELLLPVTTLPKLALVGLADIWG